jgi:hypothetical protein
MARRLIPWSAQWWAEGEAQRDVQTRPLHERVRGLSFGSFFDNHVVRWCADHAAGPFPGSPVAPSAAFF